MKLSHVARTICNLVVGCSTAAVLIWFTGCATQPIQQTSAPTLEAAPMSEAPLHAQRATADTFLFSDAPAATAYPNTWTVLKNVAYESAYDEKFRNPAWVAYHLPTTSGKVMTRPSIGYPTDNRTVSKVTAADYPAGYDHGHMAPNYSISFFFGDVAQTETFFMSNMVPQRPGLNRGPWKAVETLEYSNWSGNGHEIWVIDGPVYTQLTTSP